MTIFVAVVGVVIAGIGLTVLAFPSAMRWGLRWVIGRGLLLPFSIVRIGIGVAFVLAAPSTRLPLFVWALGLLFILAGVSLPLRRPERIERWATWWMEKSDSRVRAWSLVAIMLGALLVQAAM